MDFYYSQVRRVVLIALIGALFFAFIKGVPSPNYLPEGPAFAIGEVSKNLWQNGSVSPTYFYEMYKVIQEESRSSGNQYWQDIFSLGINGELYPKHSLISSMIGAIFYGVFGDWGFVIFQWICFLSILYAVISLSNQINRADNLTAATLILCLGTPLVGYVLAYSYDLHAVALLLVGLNLAQKRPLWGAAVMSLAVFVRPSLLLLSFPLAFVNVREDNTMRSKMDAFWGSSLIIALWFFCNYLCWGSIFETAYSRVIGFDGGNPYLSKHPIGFNWQVFIASWDSKIWGAAGIFPYSFVFVALPWSIFTAITGKKWNQIIMIVAGIAHTCYVFSYEMWHVSDFGNRLLLPVPVLFSILTTQLINKNRVMSVSAKA